MDLARQKSEFRARAQRAVALVLVITGVGRMGVADLADGPFRQPGEALVADDRPVLPRMAASAHPTATNDGAS